MKTIFYPYKIKIKFDESFDELYDYYKRPWIRSKQDLNNQIVKTLLDNDYTCDDYTDCNNHINQVISWNHISLMQFVQKCFAMHTDKLECIVGKLLIWGSKGECPECGYSMTVDGEEKKCDNTKCNHSIDIGYEKRLLEKYDISVNFEHQTLLN